MVRIRTNRQPREVSKQQGLTPVLFGLTNLMPAGDGLRGFFFLRRAASGVDPCRNGSDRALAGLELSTCRPIINGKNLFVPAAA